MREVQSTPIVSRSGIRISMFLHYYKTAHQHKAYELTLIDLLGRHAADRIEHAKAE
ncbi:MAG: hypothetical protein ACKOW3_01740 [Hyphomicrobium sp.]